MLRTVCLAAAAAVVLAPLSAAAQQPAAYKAPRTAFGQPDLMGFWSSATLTPVSRDRKLGDRLVLTPAEVKALESDEAAQVEAGNKPTDPNAPVNACTDAAKWCRASGSCLRNSSISGRRATASSMVGSLPAE